MVETSPVGKGLHFFFFLPPFSLDWPWYHLDFGGDKHGKECHLYEAESPCGRASLAPSPAPQGDQIVEKMAGDGE